MFHFRPRFPQFGTPLSRRDCLRVALPALWLPTLGQAAPVVPRKVKSVVVVFTSGGMSQLDTWDPRPSAPVEVRGAFGTCATSVPGLRFGEHLPKVAKLARQLTVIKSMTHDDADHGSACYLALTGQQHPRKSSNPKPAGTDYPSLGGVVHRVKPTRDFPHTAMQINGPLLTPREPGPGQYGGFLGRGYDPLEFGNVAEGIELLAGLQRPAGMDGERADDRRALAEQLDQRAKDWPGAASQTDSLRKPTNFWTHHARAKPSISRRNRTPFGSGTAPIAPGRPAC